MLKLLFTVLLLSASTAYAGLLDMVSDTVKQVSPEAGMAVDLWKQEEDRKQAEVEEAERQKQVEEEKKQAEIKRLEDEKRRQAEQARHEAEKARYEAEKAKYEADMAQFKNEQGEKSANEQDRRIAELEAKLKLAEQRAEKEKLNAQEAVEEAKQASKAKEVETKAETALTQDEIKQAVKSVDIPSRYAKATLMLKTSYLDGSYEEYMNFGEWIARTSKNPTVKKMWTEGGTFSDLEVHTKLSGKPSSAYLFYEDEGEVFLRGLDGQSGLHAPTNPQLKYQLDQMVLKLY